MTLAAIHTRQTIFSAQRFCALVALFCFSGQLVAAQCSASSGSWRIPLVELYTSEGCSSCPPADRWLSGLTANHSSSERVIPLALHVDYWDYIGWKDRFAQSKFSARQTEMVRLNHSAIVYTPQVMLNGKDFRAWGSDSFSRAVSEINRQPAHAWITLTLSPSSSNELQITANARARSGVALYVALYENDLQSKIKAGENQGRQLQHDSVVREWYGPLPMDRDGRVTWQQAVQLNPEWVAAKTGLVAFAQDQTTGEILQAIRLPWCAG